MAPLSESYPHLVREWSPKNTQSPTEVSASSSRKARWVCAHGHEWEVSPYSRTSGNGTGCPFCTNRRVWEGFNDLASQRPEIAAQWHPIKNGSLTPRGVMSTSNNYAWWVCPRDGYEWQTRIRTRSGPNCPLCSGKVTVSGINDLDTRFPKVAAQWHPTKNLHISPSTVSGSASKKFWWLCALGHEWEASVRNRTYAGSGCPVCVGTTVLAGFNDLESQYPNTAAQWHPTRNAYRPYEVVPGSERKVWWKCSVDGYEWQTTPASRTKTGDTGQCPLCINQVVVAGHNDLFTTHPQFRAEWSANNTVDPKTLSAGSNVRVVWRCPRDGHEWSVSPNQRFWGGKSSRCLMCVGRIPTPGVTDLRTTHPHLVGELAPDQDATAESLSAGSGPVEWICSVDGHRWTASVSARTSRGQGCPVCANKAVLAGVNDLATLRPDLAAQWYSSNDRTPDQVTVGSAYRAQWMCADGHVWGTAVSNRTARRSGCPQCWSRQIRSAGEEEVAAFLESLAQGQWTVQRNVRGLLAVARSELDAYIPELRLAVEYNGVCFHSSAFRAPNYHADKLRMCSEAGIKLIQIWEDDWHERRAVVENLLRAKLGRSVSARLFARATTPSVCDRPEAAEFLNANHIQGAVSGTWYGCLRDSVGKPTAVMVLRNRGNGSAELSRYATDRRVPGGFTKLLAFMEARLPDTVTEIVTFADLEISTGSLYEKSGFVKTGTLAPDYSYVMPGRNERQHKFLFRKNRFRADPSLKYEDGLTEKQLADLNGILRCYDSGKLRYRKQLIRTTGM